MIPVKINGNTYNFPVTLKELTLKQFFGIKHASDIIDELCAITDLDRLSILNFKSASDLVKCKSVLDVLAGNIKKGTEGTKLPKEVLINGKMIPIPKDLKLEPIGAYIAVHNIIEDEYRRCAGLNIEFNPTDMIPQVLANYFYLPYLNYGKPESEPDALFIDEKVSNEVYMSYILNISVADAVPIANFFFRKYPDL